MNKSWWELPVAERLTTYLDREYERLETYKPEYKLALTAILKHLDNAVLGDNREYMLEAAK